MFNIISNLLTTRKKLLTLNHSATSCMKSALIIVIINVTWSNNKIMSGHLSNKRKIWRILSFFWRTIFSVSCAAYNCSSSSKNSPEKISAPEKVDSCFKPECTSVHNQRTLTSYQLSSELFSNVIVLLCIAKIYRMQSLIGTLPRNDLTSIIKKVTKQVNLTFCRCLRPVSAWNWSEQIK